MRLVKVRCSDVCSIRIIKVPRNDGEFKEQEHPRVSNGSNAGEFAPKNGGTSSGNNANKQGEKNNPGASIQNKSQGKVSKTHNFVSATRNKSGDLVTATGEKIPEHITALKIPPTVNSISYNPDKNADLLAASKDSKGRPVYYYNEKFKTKQSQAKFKRIQELEKKFTDILDQNEKEVKLGKPEAMAIKLIMETGIRPGSEHDTKAKVQAYGATTLLGKHVIANKDGTVTLSFVGKKGVQNNIQVTGKTLVNYLKKKAANKEGKIFDTDYSHLLNYSHSLDGGGFKTKDFRTLLATKTAQSAIQKIESPKTEKEYMKKVKEISGIVAKKLGNTAAVCCQSYINPAVWGQWKMAISAANS